MGDINLSLFRGMTLVYNLDLKPKPRVISAYEDENEALEVARKLAPRARLFSLYVPTFNELSNGGEGV